MYFILNPGKGQGIGLINFMLTHSKKIFDDQTKIKKTPNECIITRLNSIQNYSTICSNPWSKWIKINEFEKKAKGNV